MDFRYSKAQVFVVSIENTLQRTDIGVKASSIRRMLFGDQHSDFVEAVIHNRSNSSRR